jgi:hypothetical protein
MAIAVKVTFEGTGATLRRYYEALELLGAERDGPHPDPACLFHWVTETDSGLRVTDVWTTQEAFETFTRDKLASVMQDRHARAAGRVHRCGELPDRRLAAARPSI